MDLINANVDLAPFMICGLLFLAGFNVPVSEDVMIFASALLATKNPEYLNSLFIGVFIGAYVSDLISYGLGRTLGPKLLDIRFFSSMASPKRIEKISKFYERYGIITLIFGRFIPFGVRNGLFMTAGLSKMNLVKFALADLFAATISVTTFFFLYYTYGQSVVALVKQFNLVIFIAAALLVLTFYFKKKKSAKTIS